MNEDNSSPFHLGTSIIRRSGFLCSVLVVITCGCSAAELKDAEPSTTAGPLFQEATRQFEEMTSTLYQHKTQVDRATGSYRYDCVGFVSYALKQVAPQARESAFKSLDIKPGRIPSPLQYRAFFASLAEKPQPGWQAITKVSALRPGDVVVWELEAEQGCDGEKPRS